MSLETTALEQVYDALADGIDAAGPRDEALFLARLVLLLANQLSDVQAFTRAVQAALAGLPCDRPLELDATATEAPRQTGSKPVR